MIKYNEFFFYLVLLKYGVILLGDDILSFRRENENLGEIFVKEKMVSC